MIEDVIKNCHILVVDDETSILDILEITLVKAGYKVTVTTSGYDAIKQVPFLLPDLIILDIQLLDLNGLEVCRRLKSIPLSSDIPIIFISGYSDNQMIEQTFKAGGIDFINKQDMHQTLLPRIVNQFRIIRANKALKNSLTRFENVFMTAFDPMFVVKHGSGAILAANLAAEKLYDYTNEEFLKLTTSDLSADSSITTQVHKAGNVFVSIHKNRKKDGSTFLAEIRSSYFNENGIDLIVDNVRNISEQLDKENKLIENEKRYRALVDTQQDLICRWLPDTTSTFVNQVFLQLLNKKEGDFIGKKWISNFHGETLKRCQQHVENLLIGKQAAIFELEIYDYQGQKHYIQWLDTPIFDSSNQVIEIQGVGRDITEIKSREQELIKLKTAIEQIGASIVITDIYGVIQYANPFVVEITGYPLEEIIGKTPQLFRSGMQTKEFYSELWQTIQAGRIWKGHFTNRKKDGSLYEEEAVIAPVKNQMNEICNFVAIKQDVTEFLNMEEKLHRSQKMEAIGVLAAGIAHEINSPMQYIQDNTKFIQNNLTDFIKLLGELKKTCLHNTNNNPDCLKIRELINSFDYDFLKTEVNQAVEDTMNGINKVQKIISALKDFSFPHNMHLTEGNIHKIIDSALIITAGYWKHQARIEKNYSTKLPAVPCFADDLNQVFINLLVNATDAIEVAKNKEGLIRITTALDNDFIRISISDNGIGMSSELKNRIFEPFFTTKEIGKGTGQGLSIVYSIIKNLHKGTIDVKSQPGLGSEFIIRLPIKKESS